jgi:LuxR family quorum-sensing system transcriptional regulator SinR
MVQVRKRAFHTLDSDSQSRVSDRGPLPASLRVVESLPLPLPAASPPALTRRELECLGWCADGKSYWETAVILGISERTVSFHMEAVRSKLKAATNAHAVAMALRAEMLDRGPGEV